MKDTRYKVDLSKRLDGRGKMTWLIKAKTIGSQLAVVGLVYFLIAYPLDKYKNEYLPLLTKIDSEQAKNNDISQEFDKANKELTELNHRYQTIVRVRKQRISWTEKLFNITKFIPSKVYITEIGLRHAKGKAPRQKTSNGSQNGGIKKSVYIRGLIPALKKGEYLAKIVELTKKINTDSEFAKDFFPMHLNYNKLVKLPQGQKQKEMIEFELEAVTK